MQLTLCYMLSTYCIFNVGEVERSFNTKIPHVFAVASRSQNWEATKPSGFPLLKQFSCANVGTEHRACRG